MKPTPPQTQQPIKAIDGVNFYQIQSADQILHSRMMVAEIQELYIRAGISESFLKEIAAILISKAQSSNDMSTLKSDIFAIGQHLQQRLGFIAQKSMYEELACVYFMIDDEPADYLPEWQQKKKALWGKHPKERDFFTTEAFKHINASQNISMKDILAVWEALEERLFQIPKLPT